MSEKSLEEKYNEWINENYDTEMLADFGDRDLRDGFYAGYNLAQEEMKVRLAECEEALRFYFKSDSDTTFHGGYDCKVAGDYFKKWGKG